MRKRLARTLVGALLATVLLVPAAQAKNTPNPFIADGLPGCKGNINATMNHDSGIHDHGKDSKGPGWYFRDGQAFKEARTGLWGAFCDD